MCYGDIVMKKEKSEKIQRNNLIAIAIVTIAVIVIAIIPVAISAFAPKVYSEITADGLLSYIVASFSTVGTVLLAYIAVKQNEKFKTENDAAQERLERISKQANELSAINQIINVEVARLDRIEEAFYDFSVACDPQELCAIFSAANSSTDYSREVPIKMSNAEKRADDSYFQLISRLRYDCNYSLDGVKKLSDFISEMYQYAKEYITNNNRVHASYFDNFEKFIPCRDDFIKIKETYLRDKNNILDMVLYGNMSLDEVKKVFKKQQLR